MDALIRPLRDDDRPAVARLLDDAVGAGFWRFADGAGAVSFVAASGMPGEGVAGVVIACLEPADDPDVRTALAGPPGRPPAGELVLHVRARRRPGGAAHRPRLATAGARRGRGAARAAPAAFPFGWLPAGRPEPPPCRSTRRPATSAGRDIPDFYADGSVATGALCPYCGAPPCRCAARPFVKTLAPA